MTQQSKVRRVVLAIQHVSSYCVSSLVTSRPCSAFEADTGYGTVYVEATRRSRIGPLEHTAQMGEEKTSNGVGMKHVFMLETCVLHCWTIFHLEGQPEDVWTSSQVHLHIY